MKVLLVEFVVKDSFQCSVDFPYIQGSLRSLSVATIRVQIGLRSGRNFVSEDNDAVVIPPDAVRPLKVEFERFAPHNVLFSHKPDAQAVETLFNDPACQIGYLNGQNRVVNTVSGRTSSLSDWLKLKTVSSVTRFPIPGHSDFSFLPLNSTARSYRPLPHILCSDECRYRASLSKNPVYRDLDLNDVAQHSRCTFCVRPPASSRKDLKAGSSDPLLALGQYLPVAAETTPWNRHRPRYRLIGHDIIRKLKTVCDQILKMDLPEADYLLNCRVDDIIRNKETISESLALFSRTDNRIFLCLIGIENFCDDELLRFNKGITALQIMEMLRDLYALRRRFPGHFDYHTYGGLSTILYTPWTTLENVEFNLRLTALFGLQSLCGKLLTSRLRLYENLPLYQLALKDGLIIDRYEHASFNTAFANFYPAEIPWRFCDERVTLFNRVVSESLASPENQSDRALSRAREWLHRERAKGHTTISAALKLIDGIKSAAEFRSTEIPSAEELMSNIPDDFRENAAPQVSFSGLDYSVSFKKFLFHQNPHLTGKIEYIDLSLIETAQNMIKENLGPGIRFQTFPVRDNDDCVHLCYGFDKNSVEKLAGLSRLLTTSAFSKEIIVQIGEILGYPSCCAKSFADCGGFALKYNEWLHIRNRSRVEKETEVDARMNPFSGFLSYVPCSLHCPSSRSLVEQFESYLAEKGLAGPSEEITSPVLYLLYHPGTFAKLNGARLREENGKSEILFDQATLSGEKSRLDCLTRANRLSLTQGRIAVYRDEIPLQSYNMTAAVWWHKKSFHPEFWSLCYDLARVGYSMGNFLGNDRAELMVSSPTPQSREQQIIQNLITRFADIIDQKAKARLLGFSFGENSVELTFKIGSNRMTLELLPRGSLKNPFVSGHRYSVHYTRDTEPGEPLQYLATMVLRIVDTYWLKQQNQGSGL